MRPLFDWTRYLAVLLLLLLAFQLWSGPPTPTAPEQEGLLRGYVWLTQGRALSGPTPLLAHILAALPLRLCLPSLPLVSADRPISELARQFIWQSAVPADQIMLLARLPNLLLTLLLAALVYRWAGEWYGRWAALLSLLLCVLDPNMLAQARQATADLPATCFVLSGLYGLGRFLRRPTMAHLCLTGVGLGLALSTKFSTGWVVCAVVLLLMRRAWDAQPFRLSFRLPLVASMPANTVKGRLAWLAASGLLIGLVAVLTIWAAYGGEVGSPDGLRVLSPSYWTQLRTAYWPWSVDLSPHFLRGELYVGRRWYYLAVVLLLKTPLPAAALGVIAVWVAWQRRRDQRRNSQAQEGLLFWPVAIFLGCALLIRANWGYRYILPVLPLAWIFIGQAADGLQRWLADQARLWAVHWPLVALFFALIGWYVFGTLSLQPHYLAFANEIAGGPTQAWKSMLDQDLDMGQDLGALKTWMTRHDISHIHLGYQGAVDPGDIGIDWQPLPSPHDTWETRLLFYPLQPQPGFYAISANSLQGLRLADFDVFAWFRDQEPIAQIGYTIFVYQVPLIGHRQAIACLSGLQPADILLGDYWGLFGTNDVQFKWFDAANAWIFPTQGSQDLIYLVAGDEPPRQDWTWPASAWTTLTVTRHQNRYGQDYTAIAAHVGAAEVAQDILSNAAFPVWQSPAITFLPGDPAAHAQPMILPVVWGDRLELLGYVVGAPDVRPGGVWELITWWRVLKTDHSPLKVFVHLIDHQSRLYGGDDRLDVPTDGWQAGDVFVQTHRITLPDDTPAGIYQVELGWYDAGTIERLTIWAGGIPTADRVLLEPVAVKP